MSDRKSEKEKKINRALILVAGAICGLAVCVSVLMVFAASGAFVNGAAGGEYRKPEYTVDTDSIPDRPSPDVKLPPDGEGRFDINCEWMGLDVERGALDYRLYIKYSGSDKVKVTGLTCSVYSGTVCKGTVLLTVGMLPGEEWFQSGSREFEGTMYGADDDFDRAVFILKWENEKGEEYSTYTIADRDRFLNG